MKNALILAVSFVIIGIVLYWGVSVLVTLQGVTLGFHGKLAMALGVVFTMAVGFGLMALLFYSNKNGHDEVVYHLTDDEEENT